MIRSGTLSQQSFSRMALVFSLIALAPALHTYKRNFGKRRMEVINLKQSFLLVIVALGLTSTNFAKAEECLDLGLSAEDLGESAIAMSRIGDQYAVSLINQASVDVEHAQMNNKCDGAGFNASPIPPGTSTCELLSLASANLGDTYNLLHSVIQGVYVKAAESQTLSALQRVQADINVLHVNLNECP
jgi:hypothetical protein